jgi:NADH-quinone oxidoreductase subunit G
VRFTREVSQSHALGVKHRGDHSLIRPSGDMPLDRDAYSDNIVDLCPVGALLSTSFLYKDRVWTLKATPSVCPGCERGCSIDVWHRKPEWFVRSLDARHNRTIARVTPRDNPEVNGPWICNKGRDLPDLLGRARALQPMQKGKPVDGAAAVAAARALIESAKKPVALVSSWGSTEELAAFAKHLGGKFACFVKSDRQPAAGEVLEDDLLIKADKNPNTRSAKQIFGDAVPRFDEGTDLVLVWGEGCSFADLPRGARVVFLGSWLAPENGHADVFIPVSIQTERAGHYTNFEGVVSGFEPCFPKPAGVVDAEALFALLAPPTGLRA